MSTDKEQTPEDHLDQLSAYVAEEIFSLTLKQAKQRLHVINGYTSTNCNWQNFWMAGVLKRMLINRIEFLGRVHSSQTNKPIYDGETNKGDHSDL